MRPAQTALALAAALGGGLPALRGGSRDRDARTPEVVADMKAAAEAKRERRARKANRAGLPEVTP